MLPPAAASCFCSACTSAASLFTSALDAASAASALPRASASASTFRCSAWTRKVGETLVPWGGPKASCGGHGTLPSC